VRYAKFLEGKSVLVFQMFHISWREALAVCCRTCCSIADLHVRVPAPARDTTSAVENISLSGFKYVIPNFLVAKPARKPRILLVWWRWWVWWWRWWW